jgi:hypothetical protein
MKQERSDKKLQHYTIGRGTTKIVPIDSVKPWKKNPRNNEGAIPKLAEVLKRHGQISPLIVWVKNNTIYKGNTTWKALKLIGATEVEVKFVQFKSEAAATAYALDDNLSGEWSEWDEKMLSELLEVDEIKADVAFSAEEVNLMKMGFDMEKIKKINAVYSTLKAKIVVLIVDHSSRESIIEMLEKWINASGIKNIEVQR